MVEAYGGETAQYMWREFDYEFIQQCLSYSSELRTDPEVRKKKDADEAMKKFTEQNPWSLDFDNAREAFNSSMQINRTQEIP